VASPERDRASAGEQEVSSGIQVNYADGLSRFGGGLAGGFSPRQANCYRTPPSDAPEAEAPPLCHPLSAIGAVVGMQPGIHTGPIQPCPQAIAHWGRGDSPPSFYWITALITR